MMNVVGGFCLGIGERIRSSLRFSCVTSSFNPERKASRDETSPLLHACRPSQSILLASTGSAGPEWVDGWVAFNTCAHLRRRPSDSSPPHGLLHRARHGTRRS